MSARRRPYRHSPILFALTIMVTLLVAVPVGPASANTVLEPGFVETQIAVSPEIRAPDAMKFGPDGRLYVLEQNRGQVRIVQNDVVLTTPLITLPVQTGGSRGLLAIAFDPGFSTNGFFYLNYTTDIGGFLHNRVSRFTAVGNTANPNTEVVVWEGLDLEDKTMHYGGDINFGPDGKLYITTGDRLLGANGQNMNTTWGKVLRINPNGTIPADNPFFGQTTGQNRAIWALGIRNGFKFTFQPGTSRMFIGDVGGDDWEEINQGAPGANFGWSTFEGPTSTPGFTTPLFAYNHNTGNPTGCAVMGGDFYNPNVVQFPPEFVGTYIFPDHCQGWLKSLDFENGNQLRDILTGLETPVDVKIDPNTGALYYLVRTVNGVVGGGLFRIDYQSSIPLQITQQPQSQTQAIGASATFSVSAQGSPPLTYQWQRNAVNIAGATSSSYTLNNVQPSDSGSVFRVRVTASNGTVLSNNATLTVNSNHVPVPTITSPVAGTTYVAGQQMTVTGSATDQEDPSLPDSAYSWEVVFHHNFGTPNAHTHPFIDPISGAPSLTFTIPNDNETEENVFYRIHLTVTDSGGASTEVTRDILPRTSQITLASSPPGLQLLLDDSPVTPPTTVTGVEGILRRIEAPSPQIVGATTYVFQGWSDGGAAQHTITTPTNNTTYTATFVPATGNANALFVTGDPASLGTDQTVINRLSQQLGYVVTVIDDDLVQASSTGGHDIVLVSSTVDSVVVANKLRDVTVPVMIWKPTLYDNMRMTGAVSGTDSGTIGGFRTVDIQAIAHPLAPNGAESLTILTANSTLPWGLPVGGGDVVGRTSTRASLFTYSPGDLMLTGVPAPACRIAFPLYNQAISRYTAVGWDLFDRTIDWATTGGCAAQAPLAITQQPMSTTVDIGQNATFSVSATGTPPITYQWQRNGANIPGATASSYTLPNAQASDSGAVFRVRVTDPSGTLTSNDATLTVQTTANALFVAGNPASLGNDQTVINRLSQQLGFIVTVVDDAAATAASANGQDLVLISSTVDSVSVANKFRNVAVPVMIWKPSLYDNMLMTGTVSNTDFGTFTGFRVVDIQAIAHPLAPNGAQTITIMSANSTLPFGVPVATADIVGRTNGRATLFTFSTGDVLRTGVPAPACRVAFPIYANAIPRFNAAGWDLFERTVDWATGGCVGAP